MSGHESYSVCEQGENPNNPKTMDNTSTERNSSGQASVCRANCAAAGPAPQSGKSVGALYPKVNRVSQGARVICASRPLNDDEIEAGHEEFNSSGILGSDRDADDHCHEQCEGPTRDWVTFGTTS